MRLASPEDNDKTVDNDETVYVGSPWAYKGFILAEGVVDERFVEAAQFKVCSQ